MCSIRSGSAVRANGRHLVDHRLGGRAPPLAAMRQPYGLGTLLNAIIIGVIIDSPAFIPAAEVTGGPSMLRRGRPDRDRIGPLHRRQPGSRPTRWAHDRHRAPGSIDQLTRSSSRYRGPHPRLILGGTFGIGTIVFALAIGPLVQYLPRWDISPTRSPTPGSISTAESWPLAPANSLP